MKYTIEPASLIFYFSLLVSCRGQEGGLLAPEATRFASVAAQAEAAISDPKGDAVASDGSGVIGAPHQDIVGASVAERGSTFVFGMDVATFLRAHRNGPPQPVLQEWSWNLNTDPSASPAGFPFAAATEAPPEFIVVAFWNGRRFEASVIDRRPLLAGEYAVITPVRYHIERESLTLFVDAAILGNPESFAWVARTNNWLVPLGTGDPQTLDRAPDASPALWTR